MPKTSRGQVSTIDETKYPGKAVEDKFSYPSKALLLPAGVVVSL